METVLANLASGIAGSSAAAALRDRPEATHLLVVCTAERGLCGAFNSSIVRLARDGRRRSAQGKTIKFLCVGKKGYDHLRRQFEQEILEFIELRGVRQLGFENADPIARKIIALFTRASSTCNPVLLPFPFCHRPSRWPCRSSRAEPRGRRTGARGRL